MYPTAFPRNQWYVAAQSHEITGDLKQRWLLDEPVCLYRQGDNRVIALIDRCVHRQLPLSRGRRVGDLVECGYHGIQYASDGRAVRIPSQNNVPATCRVRSYPISEQGGLVWIWMGDPALADESGIVELPWLSSTQWKTVGGVSHMKARTQLLNENLLDLSHLTFLHPDSIGTTQVAEIPVKTSVSDTSIRVSRAMDDVDSPPYFVKVMHLAGRIDRYQTAEFWPPSVHVTHVGAKPAGEPDDANLCQHKAVHCITPERERSAHYFWLVARDYNINDSEVDDLWTYGSASVISQDIEACEAIEEMITACEPDYPVELNLKVDGGPLRSRRIIEQLVAAERAQGQE